MLIPSKARTRPFALAVLTFAALFATAAPVLSSYMTSVTSPAGSGPAAIAVNPDSHRVYAANYYGSSVSVYDGQALSSLATVTIPGSFTVPNAVVVDPLSTPAQAFVANFWNGTVSVIDEESLTLTATIPATSSHGGGPRAMALDAGSASPKLYVAEYGAGAVRVYDAASRTLIKTISTGPAPRGLAIFSSIPRTRVYVANRGNDTVSVIDGNTDVVVATIPAVAPKSIAVDPSTGWAWVTNERGNSVTVIDDTDSLRGTVKVGGRPIGIAIDPVAGRVFVANDTSNTVSVIRTSDLTTEATLNVGVAPWAIAFDAADHKAFVTCYGSDSVAIISEALAVTQVPAGDGPYGVAVDEGVTPHHVYVSDILGDTVSLIENDPLSSMLPSPSVAYAADAEPVAVTVAAPEVATDGSVRLSGTAQSTRRFPARLDRVAVSIDGSSVWIPAQLTSVGDGSQVIWTASADALSAGTHSIRVRVTDQTSAASSSSDSGSNTQACVSKVVLDQNVVVGTVLQPMQGRACVTCHGGDKPGNRKKAPPSPLTTCPRSK